MISAYHYLCRVWNMLRRSFKMLVLIHVLYKFLIFVPCLLIAISLADIIIIILFFFLCVFLCARMRACMHGCMPLYVRTHACVCMCARAGARTCVYMCPRACVRACVHAWVPLCMPICVCLWVRAVHACVACVHACVPLRARAPLCVHVQVRDRCVYVCLCACLYVNCTSFVFWLVSWSSHFELAYHLSIWALFLSSSQFLTTAVGCFADAQ